MDKILTIYKVLIININSMSDKYNFVIEYPTFEYVDTN